MGRVVHFAALFSGFIFHYVFDYTWYFLKYTVLKYSLSPLYLPLYRFT